MSVRSVRSMIIACLGLMTAAPLMAQKADSTISMDSLRTLLRTGKRAIVDSNMSLTAAEATKFWPVYDAYQADLAKLNDRTVALIKEYAANYQTMTDPAADKLLTDMLSIEKDRTALLEKYRGKFAATLSARKVARYYQIENKIRAVVSYALADEVPLVP